MPDISSKRELSRICGVDPKTVRRWLRRADWPVSKSPPWTNTEFARIEQWRASLQEDRSRRLTSDAPLDAIRMQSSALYLTERARLMRLRRQRLEAELIPRSEFDRAIGGMVNVLCWALSELEQALPSQLDERSAGEIANSAAEAFDAKRRELVTAGGFEPMPLAECVKTHAP